MDLTREQALKLHREMWSDMQKELGDKPSFVARLDFKRKWCEEHGFHDIQAHCFLCEYEEHHVINPFQCTCLIDWKSLTGHSGCSKKIEKCYGYENAPISEILALPERKVEE